MKGSLKPISGNKSFERKAIANEKKELKTVKINILTNIQISDKGSSLWSRLYRFLPCGFHQENLNGILGDIEALEVG